MQEPGLAGVTRRQLLFGSATVGMAAGLLSACTSSAPQPRATAPATTSTAAGAVTPTRHAYGSDPSQFGELYRPLRATTPGVVVVIHGGFWLAEYDLSYGAPLAADLARRGYTAFNLEYRRVGDGGGWPTTLEDVAAGVDLLASLDVDSSRVVLVGHSAGGQLAVWAAGRAKLPARAPGAHPKVAVTAVVAQAGVLDLRTAQEQQLGGGAVADFLGGTFAEQPERYRIADPIEQVPPTVPVLCVHDRDDQLVPFSQSVSYVSAATAAGGQASLIAVDGDHFTLIDPTSAAWLDVVQHLPGLLAAHR